MHERASAVIGGAIRQRQARLGAHLVLLPMQPLCSLTGATVENSSEAKKPTRPSNSSIAFAAGGRHRPGEDKVEAMHWIFPTFCGQTVPVGHADPGVGADALGALLFPGHCGPLGTDFGQDCPRGLAVSPALFRDGGHPFESSHINDAGAPRLFLEKGCQIRRVVKRHDRTPSGCYCEPQAERPFSASSSSAPGAGGFCSWRRSCCSSALRPTRRSSGVS